MKRPGRAIKPIGKSPPLAQPFAALIASLLLHIMPTSLKTHI
jgi:hypothetical protein